jgi:hypothetical protein
MKTRTNSKLRLEAEEESSTLSSGHHLFLKKQG